MKFHLKKINKSEFYKYGQVCTNFTFETPRSEQSLSFTTNKINVNYVLHPVPPLPSFYEYLMINTASFFSIQSTLTMFTT